MVERVLPFGTVEVKGDDGRTFQINGQRLKHYYGNDENEDCLSLPWRPKLKTLTCVWLKTLNLALVGRQLNNSFSLFCVSFSFVFVVLVFYFVIDSCTYVFL